jgi:glycerophosphoryl diester phosphodiesterase
MPARRLRRVLAVAAVVFVALSIPSWFLLGERTLPLADHPFVAKPSPLVIAHRGGRGHWPENTLYAFRRAAELGVDVLEMDVRGTGDGRLVVFHDAEVDRLTDGHGPVRELDLAEIRALDAGYFWSGDAGASYPFRGKGIGIPTLQEVFEALPNVRMNLEIKEFVPSLTNSLCALIRERGMLEKVLVASFEHAAMEGFRVRCPQVATASTAREVRNFYLLQLISLPALFRPRAEAFQVPARLGRVDLVTPAFLREARRLNVRVHVWTANRVEEIERLLSLGVDGIMTDYPEQLMTLLGRRRG